MHVFLSYARSSEAQAAFAERALREEGYTVWRDSELPAHLSYAEVIEERLNSAKAVLVLWSAEAAKSQWVRAEADAARERGTLVQSSVDGTIPPIPFNQIQCANLTGWNGESDHLGWRKLFASIVALAGQVERPVKSAARARKASSICVLPFENRSVDEVPGYFCDGLSEDITADLAKIPALAVTPLKKAMAFKGQEADACMVAEKLGVTYVLEGAVLRAGDRVRITTQLVDGATGEQAWSDRYHRDFSDIFSIQDEISRAIVAALKVKLLPAEAETPDAAQAKAAGDGSREAAAEAPSPAFAFAAGGAAAAELAPDPLPAPEPASEAPPAAPEPASEPPPAEPEPEVATAAASVWDRSFDDGPAAEAQEEWDSAGQWSSEGDWDADEDEPRRGFRMTDLAPRLIGAGLVVLIAAVLIGVFYWPTRSQPAPAPKEDSIAYTVTATVNVRSLPSRTNSRILGTLEPGETINIVPDLAGAQPDWLKIKDGPYVGAYVWRESTRPLSGPGSGGDTGTVKEAARRKDATG